MQKYILNSPELCLIATGTIDFSTMGTASTGESFMAVVGGLNEVLPAVGAQTYYLGTSSAETVLWDDFGTFDPGPHATGCFFTVPRNGRYAFNWTFLISILSVVQLTIFIDKNGTTFFTQQKQVYSTTGAGNYSGSFSNYVLIDCLAGDIIKFGTTFNGSNINPILFLGLAAGDYKTWVSGMLLRTT